MSLNRDWRIVSKSKDGKSKRRKFGFVSQVKCWFTWLEEIEAVLDARITNLDRV